MRTLIIGHRGVGKTAFLQRVQNYFAQAGRNVATYDLDHWIEEKEKTTIPEIFASQGEAAFRQLEQKYFQEISNLATGEVFLSVGAGFQVPTHHDWTCLWLRRPTDSTGRIFLNRPRLEKGMDPLAEYLQRYQMREPLYAQTADEILTLQEGFDFETDAEKAWVLNEIRDVGGALTVDSKQVQSISQREKFFERRSHWGVKFFELRDDLLSNEQITWICDNVSSKQLLLSFRRKDNLSFLQKLQAEKNLSFDWPLEWGDIQGKPTIISYHQRDSDLARTLDHVSKVASQHPQSILKLAVPIHTFQELFQAHQWQQVSPNSRSFLPMSETGRWRWYRTIMKHRMPLQFWKEGAGSAKDQPSLLEWLRFPAMTNAPVKFSAILGDPVEHSRTPGEQYRYFHSRSMAVVSIRMTGAEASSGAFRILQDLGLRCASVTSPLKEWAFQNSQAQDEMTKKLQATNTLFFNQGQWLGTNTDLFGVQETLRKKIPFSEKLNFAIWGGGGTLEVLREALPLTTTAFSAQSGKARNGETEIQNPDVVVWAVGRKNWELSKKFPPESWKPQFVFDLNYSEDSPGIEYALLSGARYIDGLEMFRAQAEGQRKFWSYWFKD